ncbi:Crp/Fnr family transcriptional regulator [Sporolactobacillus sp. THM7-4]|nr:Crp/Fnr family transcriptional regulator [Sporolactobacillus sp. THM7-4]
MHHCAALVPLFSRLESADQAKINRLINDRSYRKGEQIIWPGCEPQLVIVARGAMKVYQLSPSGKEQLLRLIEPGGYEGEAGLLGASNDNLFAEALQQTTVCVLRRRDFTQLLLTCPELSLKLLESNAEKMVSVEQQAQFLMMGTVESRLATYLACFARTEEKTTFQLPMKLKELAGFLGTTAETLSRTFRLLEDQGLVRRDRRQVTICDAAKLEKMHCT